MMSEVSNSQGVQSAQQNAKDKSPNPEPRKCFSNPPLLLLVVAVFILAVIVNWNDQRRTANFESDISGFENALQDYVSVVLAQGAECLDYAHEDKIIGLVLGRPDFQNETAEGRVAIEGAASRLRAAVEVLSPDNRTIAVNRINTVIDEANDKLSSRPRTETPGVFRMSFADRRLYLVNQAQENGADLNAKVGPNAPWETRAVARVVFAVGWRSALVALVADVVLGMISVVLLYCWVFLLNRIRELGRAARGMP